MRDCSPGFCDGRARARLRGPFEGLAMLTALFARLGLEPVDVLPGRRLLVVGGEDEGG